MNYPALWTFVLFLAATPFSAQAQTDDLAAALRKLDASVIVHGKVRTPPLASMLARDVEAKLREANRADAQAWAQVKSLADWNAFREARIKTLRASLGNWPAPPKDLKVRVTGRLDGDGYRIENLVYESKPGSIVTANLYLPAKPGESMPGIVIVHSHNSLKHTTARQDMGMTWARAGCAVLIPDHVGAGERRQHPFGAEPPHDYHGRYDAGIQLHLVGESLMGWMAWDLMRGVDVLLAQKGVDPGRILMISEPAGGGDVAAVTAALDPRIACAMINNFGGPEPEDPFPLPRDIETSFLYSGSGSWEPTRNLRLSARDGFLPWTIVASVAPRRLFYYHEFYWDEERDPAWKRIRQAYQFADGADKVRGRAGSGFVVGQPPENTHWIAINREILYPDLEQWFKIPNPTKEYSNRRPLEEFTCLTPETAKELQPVHVLAGRLAEERLAAARTERGSLRTAEANRVRRRQQWTQLLGDVTPVGEAKITSLEPERSKQLTTERFYLQTEPGVVVPVLLLIPDRMGRAPFVVCLAQEGKQEFLKQRAEPIVELLNSGTAVVLLDVRGTGETDPGGSRGRSGPATQISSSAWMLGQSLLGGRLRDLLTVLHRLERHEKLDASRIGLWGDSFAPVNAADRDLNVPHNAANRPGQSEPLGGLLALLGGLFDDKVKAVYVHGGLSDYASALNFPLVYMPHDVVVPGVLAVGDVCDLAAALTPRPLWMERMVDAQNRAVSNEELARRFATTTAAYGQSEALRLGDRGKKESPGQWFAKRLSP